jgi:Flp pilus assembly CpaE family ATPase
LSASNCRAIIGALPASPLNPEADLVRSIGIAVAHPDPGIVDELVHAVEASGDLYLALDPSKASVVLAGGNALDGIAGNPPPEGTAVVGLAAGHDLAEVSRAALRCSAHEIVCWPQDRPSLRGILRDAASRARLAARRSDGRIIAVVGARGGAGTTTVAAMLARALGAVVVDLDALGAGQAAFLADGAEPTLAEVFSAVDDLDVQALSAAITPHAAGRALACAPGSVAPTADQTSRLVALLRAATEASVCDLCRAGDPATRTALSEADKVVCVCAPDVASMRGARGLISGSIPGIQVVLNRARRGGISAREAARVLGATPSVVISEDGRVRRAGEAGRLPSRGAARRAMDGLATAFAGAADGS